MLNDLETLERAATSLQLASGAAMRKADKTQPVLEIILREIYKDASALKNRCIEAHCALERQSED